MSQYINTLFGIYTVFSKGRFTNSVKRHATPNYYMTAIMFHCWFQVINLKISIWILPHSFLTIWAKNIEMLSFEKTFFQICSGLLTQAFANSSLFTLFVSVINAFLFLFPESLFLEFLHYEKYFCLLCLCCNYYPRRWMCTNSQFLEYSEKGFVKILLCLSFAWLYFAFLDAEFAADLL